MCLILFGYKISDQYPLVFIANRDEFYQRPTAPMHFWEKNPDILAGKDLEQGGTWFGIHKNGRFAGLTNYRNPSAINPQAPSRGEIIVDFLESKDRVENYFKNFAKTAGQYNGFNLIFGDKTDLYWFSNLKPAVEKIPPGIHGLSNRFLNTAWPKVEQGKTALKTALEGPIEPEALLNLLTDQSVPEDEMLPSTGMDLEWERLLSPLFIQSETYGTRSSILMLMDQKGVFSITERTYSPENKSIYQDRKFILPA